MPYPIPINTCNNSWSYHFSDQSSKMSLKRKRLIDAICETFSKPKPRCKLSKTFRTIMKEYQVPNERILCLASEYGIFEVVQEQLNQGIDPNLKTFPDTFFRPLHQAAANRHSDIVQLLISHGADVNLISQELTALNLAVAEESLDLETVKILLKNGANPNIFADGRAPIHMITSNEYNLNLDILQELLKYGAKVNVVDAGGNSPLSHICGKSQNIEAISLLIQYGGDVNLKVLQGDSLLHYVSQFTNLQAMNLLLTHGADANSFNYVKTSPMHELALNNEKENTEVITKSINLLAKYEANCDAQDMVGKTPLHYAVKIGNVEIVNCLKKINANWNSIRDQRGFSAFEEALLYKKLDIFKTFLLK